MQTGYRTQTMIFSIYVADDNGKAIDLSTVAGDVLQWRIFASETAYNQVEPLAGWNIVDLVAERVSLGLYQVSYTVPLLAVVGEYSLEVQRLNGVTLLRKYRQEFEIITAYIPDFEDNLHLCLVRDLRAEGVAITTTDFKIARAITRGDTWLERYCARTFQPRFARFKLICRTAGVLKLPEPLCWLQSVESSSNELLLLSSMNLFSRYLRQLKGAPGAGEDDRDNSKIVFSGFIQNEQYWVSGVWGYSQADGSEIGCVPEQIRLAAINLGLKYQTSLMGSGSGAIPGFTDRLISEKTATQSYNLSPLDSGSVSMIAGDSELYRLLKQYRRPPQMGWA